MRMLRWGVLWAAAVLSLALGAAPSSSAQSRPAGTAAPESASTPLAHGHAHNDYLNAHPLTSALGHGFTSVEADVWLENGKLLLCHDYKDGKCYDDTPRDGGGEQVITTPGELGSAYLQPLAERVAASPVHRVYDNWAKPFYLVIEIKCQSDPSSSQSCGSTYPLFVAHAVTTQLRLYQSMLTSYDPGSSPAVTQNAVTVVFTGANGSIQGEDKDHPRSYFFDANLSTASTAQADVTPMLIANYGAKDCAGTGALPAEERTDVQIAHAKGIVVRVYNLPDCPWRTYGPNPYPSAWDQQRLSAWQDVAAACVDYLSSDHLGLLDSWLSANYADGCGGGGGGGGGGGSGLTPTSLTYTGPITAEYRHPFTASATLTAADGPVSGDEVTFSLGDAASGETCTGTTDSSGTASCTLDPNEEPGTAELTVSFNGDDAYAGTSIVVPFTITRERTTLTYTGPAHIANGSPAGLSAVLKADDGSVVTGRPVKFSLGTGTATQACSAATDSAGTARCAIGSVSQPLTDSATTPLAVEFTGDAYYLPSSASATLRLQYMTGRAYGLVASVPVPLLPVTVGPDPDTGQVRTASAVTAGPSCLADVTAVALSASSLCAQVVTSIAPGTATATTTVADAKVGLAGLPLVELSGVTATSASTCTAASGGATLTVSVAGVRVTVPTAPNSAVGLGDGLRLVVNEQTPVSGADSGITVNAAHLTGPGGLDVVVASSTTAAHNCT